VFSITQAFFGYSLSTYILEHYEWSPTIGDLLRQPKEKTGKIIYLERLWQYLPTFMKTVLNTLANFMMQDASFELFSKLHRYFRRLLPASEERNLILSGASIYYLSAIKVQTLVTLMERVGRQRIRPGRAGDLGV